MPERKGIVVVIFFFKRSKIVSGAIVKGGISEAEKTKLRRLERFHRY